MIDKSCTYPLYGEIVDWSCTPRRVIAYVASESGLRWIINHAEPTFITYEPFDEENKIVDIPTKYLLPLPFF